MKSICKKIMIAIIAIVILFNFILNPISFAGSTAVRDFITTMLGTFVGVITWIPRVMAIGLGYAIDALSGAIAYIDGATPGNSTKFFVTPFDIVFNKTAITDIDFFDFSSELEGTTVYEIRQAVSGWYYFMRLIAVAILLVILVYVGIRMAISTVAEDKAKYKKMLVDWASSLALVFVLQYIMIFLIALNHTLVDAMAKAAEDKEFASALNQIALTSLLPTIEGIGATVVFFLFIVQTFSILFSYINRMIRVAFLIIIAPLITITYSIDKMGDGKAQALNGWLKEFLTAVLIQPFHCVIYMMFINIAVGLLTNPDDTGTSRLAAAVIAILCMMFIKDAEQIVRSIFKLDGDGGASSIASGAAIAGAALHKSKDIGKAARKGVNSIKEMKPKMKEAAKTIKNTTKASIATVGDKLSGRGGPGFKQNYQLAKADTDMKAEQKHERKMERMYLKNKEKGRVTKEDKSRVVQEANKLRKENPGLSREAALRKARANVAEEKIRSGQFSNKAIRGVRGFAKGVSRTYRTFAQSGVGKYLNNSFHQAVGIATGSMLAFNEDPFQAFAGGAAAHNAMKEFMTTSNSYIAEEASDYARGAGMTNKDEITESYQRYTDGTVAKELEDNEKDIEGLFTTGQIKKEDGSDYSKAEIQSAMIKLKHGLSKNPDANIDHLLARALNRTAEDIQKQVGGQLSNLLDQFKTLTNEMSMNKTLENGLSYGASLDTLASATAKRAELPPVKLPNDDSIVDGLYEANSSVRKEKLITEEVIERRVVTNLNAAGIRLEDYITRLKAERRNFSREEETLYGKTMDDNIKALNNYAKKHPSP